ncbi:hypothetical protein BDN70DRAFT_936587 [Pholiota conissans]|uniref:F-box domain-containing protein n=1 Tax=Pholiota conissans TaxID=109636 RepID=A0A9P5YST3_9AGAR|nr:hypothetical protein BDN70DRAFT_936587 [Pholiota conissans]
MTMPSLPAELHESILDIVHTFNAQPRFKTMASLALVCRGFRQHINRHRFKTVELCSVRDILPMYHLLASDSVWKDERDRLTAHVKAFEVDMWSSMKQLEVHPMLADDSSKLEYIFNNIFRACSQDDSSSVSLLFFWKVQIRRDDPYIGDALDWTNMSSGLQSTFRAFLRHPRLTRLVIYTLTNMPRDLLRASPVRDLQLTDITFAKETMASGCEGILSTYQLQHMSRIVTDHCVSLMEYVGMDAYDSTSPPAMTLFPRLKKLDSYVFDDESYEITVYFMRRSKNLQELALIIGNCSLPRTFQYNYFTNLNSIALHYTDPLCPLAPDYPGRVRNLIAPLSRCIPTVNRLEISAYITSTNNHAMDIESLFKGHDFSAIDDFLAEFSPPSLQIIEINLTVVGIEPQDRNTSANFSKQEGGDYVRSVCFTKLARMLPAFRVVVEVMTDL